MSVCIACFRWSFGMVYFSQSFYSALLVANWKISKKCLVKSSTAVNIYQKSCPPYAKATTTHYIKVKYKRSADVSVQVDVASAAEAMERYNLNLPYTISKESARSMLSRGRRKKRGVYNECCEKACSHEELRNYCAPRRYNRNTSDGR
ncbi:uncharacterized protein LOC109597751 isoform X1 [Aethina tumida]|uniref:uncharacterized protein LOC109597751 isoform X1 n=1 Tax=Aethina tumida TaxID=116153 RepID=UPI0021483BCB|nr:uncharacterized protein LOC109597751 isoform X1 [Aethina tumida]